MARGNTWTNADGLVVGFAQRDTYNPESASIHTKGREKQIDMIITDDAYLDTATGTLVGKEAVIPSGSVIRSARVNVTEEITGATDFIVGLKDNATGATIDDDGLITAVESALTVGVVDGATGALLGTATSADAVVSFDFTGTPTAGEVVVYVVYEEPVASQEPPAVIVGEI